MEQENNLPHFLLEALKKQYGEDICKRILEGYKTKRVVSLRVNTLKSTIEEVCKIFLENKMEYEKVSWSDTAFIIKNTTENEIKKLDIYEKGYIYLQSLSSMLPPILMEPKENTDILDMTAAPGGKTTQIAALTNNKANITACEMNGIRIEKLKYNVLKQGATSVAILQEDSRKLSDYFAFDQILLDAPCSGSGILNVNNVNENFSINLINKCKKSQISLLKKAIKILKPGSEMVLVEDARNLSNFLSYDKVLLDAPCSGSGTIRLNEPQTYQNFSEKLVQKSTQSQLILLKKAFKILKTGKAMIYSTCSILLQENEEIVSKALKGTNAKIVPISLKGLEEKDMLPTKISGTLCIAPSSIYDGFFIAKIQK